MTLDATATPNIPRIPAWTLGDRLRKARVTAMVRVDEMADHLDVSPDTVTNYEKDKTRPRRSVLMAYADLCNVPLEWIEVGESSGQADDTRAGGRRGQRAGLGKRYRTAPSQLRWKTARQRRRLILAKSSPPGGSPDPCRFEAPPRRVPAVDTPHATATDSVTCRAEAH